MTVERFFSILGAVALLRVSWRIAMSMIRTTGPQSDHKGLANGPRPFWAFWRHH